MLRRRAVCGMNSFWGSDDSTALTFTRAFESCRTVTTGSPSS